MNDKHLERLNCEDNGNIVSVVDGKYVVENIYDMPLKTPIGGLIMKSIVNAVKSVARLIATVCCNPGYGSSFKERNKR